MRSVTRDLPAWGISLIINLAILIPLHFIVREANRQPESALIDSVMEELDEQEYTFSSTVADQIGQQGVGEMQIASHSTALSVGRTEVTPQQRMEQVLAPTEVSFEPPLDIPYESEIASMMENVGPVTEDVSESGVAGAMDRITYEIASSLKERQTLVIWLFDGSQSLNDRREAIAERFENVYGQLQQMGAYDKGDESERKINGLYTAVASYQDQTALMTPQPVEDITAVVEAVRKITPDPNTPKENVFSAVKLVMNKWATFHRHEGRWNKLVFIVTDEKGENEDAIANLEDAINIAKRMQFRIYVAGNAAVFGQEKGLYTWKYEDGFVEQLPIDQGPESAFPTVLQLPYWGSGQVKLSAGFGPFALTRLTAETGGMYLITEDTTSVRFDPARMREYMPEYNPIRELEAAIVQHPARAALVETARQTYLDNIPLPTLVFNGENDNILRNELTEGQRGMVQAQFWVDRMHATLKNGAQARDTLAEPRWRASFDLAMGRLLAMKVRLYGYNMMLAQMKSNPKTFTQPGYNEWKLVPSANIDTGPDARKAAEEARTLLKKVIDEHPGTPWEQLAVKELGQDMGWDWQEGIHYVAGMEDRTDIDPDVVQLLLADEMRRQQQRTMQAVERPKPNL